MPRGNRRSAHRSTGATTCSLRPSACCSRGWRRSSAAAPWRPRKPCVRAGNCAPARSSSS
jgi:hypothetical protein